jgi:sec-independent protein translocase protein TatC
VAAHEPPLGEGLFARLAELRRRLTLAACAWVGACVVAWSVKERLLSIFVEPFVAAWRDQRIGPDVTLHFATPGAAFVAYLKLAMLGGTALASPLIFYQLWRLVAPGLHARRKRFVIPFVLVSSALFVGGGYFGWRAAFPIAFRYLLGLSGSVGHQGVHIVPTVMVGEYIQFVSQLLLAFGAIFEIPVVVFFLSIAGIVNHHDLVRYARWYVVAAFVVAAFLTPPDVASQLMMALPMLLLYAASIAVAKIFTKKPLPKAAVARARKATQPGAGR